MRTSLKDRAMFWVTAAAVLWAIAVIPFVIGIAHFPTELTTLNLINNGGVDWLALWGVLGTVALGWSVVLQVAHGHAEGHMCPDPAAHHSQPTAPGPTLPLPGPGQSYTITGNASTTGATGPTGPTGPPAVNPPVAGAAVVNQPSVVDTSATPPAGTNP